MSIFTKQRHTEIERRLRVPKGVEGGGEDRELELADANWYIRGGKTTRSCCAARGTTFSVL